MAALKIDEIGPWTEVKLDILKRYAVEYSKILSNQKAPPFYHVYIDAFAGAGYHLSKTSGEWVLGSPLNALLVQPPFREYHLIDLDGNRIAGLNEVIGQRSDVFLHKGNCNEVLLQEVFPRVKRDDFTGGGYKRGLCLLDPYGLTLDWKVIQEAGTMQSLDIFINFPIYDINLNVLHHDPSTVLPMHIERMNAYWGDEWVIMGGESGPGARPMRKEWVVSIREQCKAARVPFFFKQWGGTRKSLNGRKLQGRTYDEYPERISAPVPERNECNRLALSFSKRRLDFSLFPVLAPA